MKVMHYFPSSQLSRNMTYCGKVIDWISGTVIATALPSEVTCPDCLKPKSEADYWLGYSAAKGALRSLLRKVPEEQMPGVVHAWLLESLDKETDDRG